MDKPMLIHHHTNPHVHRANRDLFTRLLEAESEKL